MPFEKTLLSGFALLAVLIARPAAIGDEAEQLHQLFRDDWQWRMQDQPVAASNAGDKRFNDRWPDLSPAAYDARLAHAKESLQRLKSFDFSQFSEEDQLNYTLFERELNEEIEGFQYLWRLLPLTQRGGVQTAFEVADVIAFETVRDYDDWIARLNAFPDYLQQTTDLMKEGIRRRMTHPKVIMTRIPDQIAAQFVNAPENSPFYAPFDDFASGIPVAERERLIGEARTAISSRVIPAFRKFKEFFENEYLPACYDRVGVFQVPRGKEIYSYKARFFTTTPMTPEEIHAVGLSEVKRIRAEMRKIIEQVKFDGSFAEFLEFLRTDSQFYYSSGEELLTAYRAMSREIDPKLVRLFRTMPRMPYGVEPIPSVTAPDTTTAYYRPPAADGSRAGTYFVNLYKPEVRPIYEMEALSLHEAVPGHHFQIALAMELSDLPPFRRYGERTVYVEGWALYCESLGDELGLYKDPYSKFGQLTYEMWRAVRLVVDTGMHYLGWTREEAIAFFKANAAKTEQDIVNEIDRYISWPGQALAYKIGELKIKELRAKAERRLEEKFDVREFHDVILLSGPLPLDVLEAKVNRWINARATNAIPPRED